MLLVGNLSREKVEICIEKLLWLLIIDQFTSFKNGIKHVNQIGFTFSFELLQDIYKKNFWIYFFCFFYYQVIILWGSEHKFDCELPPSTNAIVNCLHDDLVVSDVLVDVAGVELCKARKVSDDDVEHNWDNVDVVDEAAKPIISSPFGWHSLLRQSVSSQDILCQAQAQHETWYMSKPKASQAR